MRFEFNSDDVMTLIDMYYDLIETIRVGSMNPNSKRIYLTRIKRMITKVKVYGEKAFVTRETYRATLVEMKDVWDTCYGSTVNKT
jgi:hypothetical protein